MKFALVQSDVYQSFLDQAAAGNAEAGAMIRPLRVIMPLYNEEIYFIVRADSELNFVHEIRNAKINAGEQGSGTALTSSTLYRLMFGEPHCRTPARASCPTRTHWSSWSRTRRIDVVAVVAGQPAKLLVDMKPEARQRIKLLKFDANHPASKAVLKTYFQATVRASNYPNLLRTTFPGSPSRLSSSPTIFRSRVTKATCARLRIRCARTFRRCKTKDIPSGARSSLRCLISVVDGSIIHPVHASSVPASAAKAKPKAPPPRGAPSRSRSSGCANSEWSAGSLGRTWERASVCPCVSPPIMVPVAPYFDGEGRD